MSTAQEAPPYPPQPRLQAGGCRLGCLLGLSDDHPSSQDRGRGVPAWGPDPGCPCPCCAPAVPSARALAGAGTARCVVGAGSQQLPSRPQGSASPPGVLLACALAPDCRRGCLTWTVHRACTYAWPCCGLGVTQPTRPARVSAPKQRPLQTVSGMATPPGLWSTGPPPRVQGHRLEPGD